MKMTNIYDQTKKKKLIPRPEVDFGEIFKLSGCKIFPRIFQRLLFRFLFIEIKVAGFFILKFLNINILKFTED